MINDILDVSKLEVGKFDLAEEVIDLAKTIADLVALAEAKARASRDPDSPRAAKGSSRRSWRTPAS